MQYKLSSYSGLVVPTGIPALILHRGNLYQKLSGSPAKNPCLPDLRYV